MDGADVGHYNRTRIRRAKRLVADFFSNLDALAKEAPNEAELVRLEQERIAALLAGRRQREAKLVGEFDSDEIYYPGDEDVLSMRQAQRESRRRIKALCEGRKRADCISLVTDDLIRELQTYLTSCSIFVGFLKPGRTIAEVMCPSSRGQHVQATVRRDGDIQRQDPEAKHQTLTASIVREKQQQQQVDNADGTFKVGTLEQDEERPWERTSAGDGQLPNPDTVFKCVDAGKAVVVGLAANEREERFVGDAGAANVSTSTEAAVDEIRIEAIHPNSRGADQDERTASTSSLQEGDAKREQTSKSKSSVESCPATDDTRYATGAQRTASTNIKHDAERLTDDTKAEPEELQTKISRRGETQSPSLLPPGTAASSRKPIPGPESEVIRPQVCVPLVGAGDSGCIGMVGAQGFTTGASVGDDSWQEWFMHRMEPLNIGENRNVKRLKLVRPRGLPDIGKLEDVPTGTAAKVVYGSVEKISRKRGMPVYTVRWEDGLSQLNVPKRYMRQVVAEDDASAGKGVPLTAEVVEHLTWIGKTVGPVLDEVRKAIHLTDLAKVTVAGDTRSRGVLELALLSLVECLPSIDFAEVWQLDNDGSIRCVQGLIATAGEGGRKYYRSNERVDSLLHDEDAEEFSLKMEPEPIPDAAIRGTGDETTPPKTNSYGKREKKKHGAAAPKHAVHIPKGLVIRPKMTCGVLAAAPFRDYSFKVGRSWIGADRLARGFALVLRTKVPNNGRAKRAVVKDDSKAVGRPSDDTRSPERSGGWSKAGGPAATMTQHDGLPISSRSGSVEDGAFAARVAGEVGVALACVRGRERRAAIRAQALKKLSNVCLNGKPSGNEAKEAVLTEISKVLPGCRAYVGVLKSGGHALLYEAATPNSAMKGRELRRGEGISLSCLDDPDGEIRVIQHREGTASGMDTGAPEPVSLQEAAKEGGPKPPNFRVGDVVEVWYASSWLPATVVRAWGHQCYDVRYEQFKETEAGVPGWRMREVITLEHLDVKLCWEGSSEQDGSHDVDEDTRASDHSSKAWPWPFVCAPLRSGGNRVGVLGVDGWSDVELGRPDEVHPEKSVVKFIREAANLLAGALYTERRNRGLSALGKTLREQDTTQNGALEALLVLLRETITFRTRIDVLETRASDPGAVYCRGTWQESSSEKERGTALGQRDRRPQAPARVFDVGVAPRVEELCLTPAQYMRLSNDDNRDGGGPLSPHKQAQQSLLLKEITPYQKEMHCITRDGLGATSGLQAKALTTPGRRGEIVGRFQRLLVRAGGGRPSADGWYFIRVARALPEDIPLESSDTTKKIKSKPKATKARGVSTANNPAVSSEDGDICLLSEMCRKLEIGFMAIASREQRALVRVKAMNRVLNCCKGFKVAAAAASSPTASKNAVADDHSRDRAARTDASSAIVRTGGGSKPATGALDGPGTKGGALATVDTPKHKAGQRASKRSGKPGTSDKKDVDSRTSATIAMATEETGDSSSPRVSAAVAVATGDETKTSKRAAQHLIFSTPVQAATPAETVDGRKGALVTLKDGRLAVLVHQGDKRVAVVEQPGGRQHTLPESEVVPGQTVFLQSGREALLVETTDNSNALLVVNTSGKANVVEETGKGKLSKLPLSVLKDLDAVAALAAGEGPPGAIHGAELIRQVIASTQWVMPQVDIYVGELSPFGSSVRFATASSRSNASGRFIHRHSKPNGGPTFGVVEDSGAEDDSQDVEKDEVQSPSWDVIDNCTTAVIPGVYSQDSSRLHFFSDPMQQGWPWVAVPIRPSTSSRAVRGIFCVDRFEDPWADEETVTWHPEKDVLAYLETCASELGLALDREAKSRAHQRLRSITLDEDTAVATAPSRPGSSSPPAAGKTPGGGVRKHGAAKRDGGVKIRDESASVSSAQDVYAAVATSMSQALVHCTRFEVWEATQPCDEEGRFFLEPSLAGQPPPFEAEDGDTRDYLKLQITHCTGLAKADRFGLSDPLCIVKWPRHTRELARTPTVYNTVHPVWKACFFELPLETAAPATPVAVAVGGGGGGGGSGKHSGDSSFGKSDSVEEGNRASGWTGGGGSLERQEKETMELTVQVWDEDGGVAADFLGEVKLDAQALLEMTRGRLKLVLPLEVKHDGSMTKKEREHVQGSIGLCLAPATYGALSRLQESIDVEKVFLEVTIEGSLGLRRGDGACVFAIATLDGRDVGSTAAMPNGFDPVWMETVRIEIARDRLRLQNRQHEGEEGRGPKGNNRDSSPAPNDLSIIVWNRVQGRRQTHPDECEFVGRLDLSVSRLVAFAASDGGAAGGTGDAKTTKTHKLPLKNKRGNEEEGCLVFTVQERSPSEWRAGLVEAAAIAESYGDAANVEASGLDTVFDRRVRLTVLRATGLAQADDSGGADPMCVLRRWGREVGRTTTIYGSLDPVWGTKSKEGESFLLTIPHPREASFGGGGVVLEIFDEDFGDPSDFLGQVIISGNDLLRFHSPGTFKGAEAQYKQVELQKKPEVPLSDQWLVQGDLFYKLEGVDKGDEDVTDTVVIDHARIVDGPTDLEGTTGGHAVPLLSSQYRRLEIWVMEAGGLAKADRFGLSDPYVVIRANGQTQLGRTRTIALSLDPVWTNPEERFVVAVGLEDAAKCDLTLEVWDEDDLGQGDFLGQVSLPKAQLLEFILPTGPIECELEKKQTEDDGFNELVQGVLTFSIREAYGNMPDEPPEGEGSGGQVMLTILSAKGLAKADVFGKSDPFGMVLLNRREIGRTRTLFKTLDPCWSEPRETFSLRVAGNRCNVIVQLWDEDLGKRGDFLGQASLTWRDLHLLPGEASRELNLALGFRDDAPKRDQELVQGTVQLLVEAPVAEIKVGDGVARSYVVTVDRAWGLGKADRFGKADPIVSIKVNGDGDNAERGRTHSIAGTLQPVWRNPPEVFILTAVEEIVLEVWDVDFHKKSDFLGEVRLSKQDLAEKVPIDGAHEFTAALQPKPNVTDKFNRLVQGSLRFTCQDWMSPERLVLEGLGEELKLFVVSASGLPRGRHFGVSDPLACVRWNGLEVGRTRVIKKSTSPAWDEGFQIATPLEGTDIHQHKGSPGNPNIEVVVEILHASAGGSATALSTVAGARSGLIGHVVLGESTLRLPEPGDGPPCKVVELPIELQEPPSTTTKRRGLTTAKQAFNGVQNHSGGERKRPATIILFLERRPPPMGSPPSRDLNPLSALHETKATTEETSPTATAAKTDGRDWTDTTRYRTTVEHDTNVKDIGHDDRNDMDTAAIIADSEQERRGLQRSQRSQRPPAREKMQIKVYNAWGLSSGARALDVVVTVMACGRGVGTTHVSSVGGTTSPEWINEHFILPLEMCAELSFDVWGRKMGNQDTFLGRASLRSTRRDMDEIAAHGEPLELPLRRKSPEALPLEDQTLVKGHLLFSLNPWHDFDYAGELDKSRANRSLQVQVRLVGATNLTSPSASVFATFSFRGTELSKTEVVPTRSDLRQQNASLSSRASAGVTEAGLAPGPGAVQAAAEDSYSHVWSARHSNTCTVPLAEECVDRRETEIEIDLWEEGGPEKEYGDHLGQVVLSGDFVPHLAHGAVVCRPLRPQRSHRSTSNPAARGSLSFQLWLRRGGESLASEFVHSALTVEVLAAKGLPPPSGRWRRAFCIVKEDEVEIGRTQTSVIDDISTSTAAAVTTDKGVCMPGVVSWEDDHHEDTNQFAVTLSPRHGGGLPLELTVELWETSLAKDEDDDEESISVGKRATGHANMTFIRSRTNRPQHEGQQSSVRRIGTARVRPDTLLLSVPGRVSLPLEILPAGSNSTCRRGAKGGASISPGVGAAGTKQTVKAGKADEAGALTSKIVLRVTPQAGLRWARRVMTAARAAKRFIALPSPPTLSPGTTLLTTSPNNHSSTALSGDTNDVHEAHVVYMTNAEGSARKWRAPVTPGNSIPCKDYEDVLELVFASVPACCPRAPSLLVAPVSDIGVRLGKVWIGPKIAARHALVAHRPEHYQQTSSNHDKKNDGSKGLNGGDKKTSYPSSDGGDVPVEPPREDELFVRVVAAEAEGLLRNIRARDMRTEQRRMTLSRVREICDAWNHARARRGDRQHQGTAHPTDHVKQEEPRRLSSTRRLATGGSRGGVNSGGNDGDDEGEGQGRMQDPDSDDSRDKRGSDSSDEDDDDDDDDDDHIDGRAYGDLYRRVLRALEIALPGVSIYLGLLESGAQSIRYVACTRQSSMAGKQLKRGEGISFSCVGPSYAPYVVYPPRTREASRQGRATINGNSQARGPPRNEEEKQENATPRPVSSSSLSEPSTAEAVETATAAEIPSSARHQTPHAERSLEEGVVSIQKVFRGKLDRDRMQHAHQQHPAAGNTSKGGRTTFGEAATKKPALMIPKVFDYESRVGWPFVCVPLEGFLRSSSIGVMGLDTFEQMGNSGSVRDQPETGVVRMVAEAARALGNAVSCDRRRRALNAVAESCLSLKSSLIDVLIATAKAVEDSIIPSSRAEVWKVDPSDGSLFVVTKRLPGPTDHLLSGRATQPPDERLSCRQLKVEVTAAELSPAMADQPATSSDPPPLDYYEVTPSAAAEPVRAIQSVAVRISTTTVERGMGRDSIIGAGNKGSNSNAFRTAPFYVKQLSTMTCSPQWYEGHRRLHVTNSVTSLRAEILAKVDLSSRGNGGTTMGNERRGRQQQLQAPPAEGVTPTGRGVGGAAEVVANSEIVLAYASVDLNAVRDGYNYVQLFSSGHRDDDTDDGGGSSTRRAESGSETDGLGTDEDAATVKSARPMGQLVLHLSWVEPSEGGGSKGELGGGRGYTTLVIHGASGLAKADRLGDSDPYCVVKWGGVELGRTKTCPNTREPKWGGERFRLALPAEEPNDKKKHLPLILEVWDEDMPETKGDFLGQVVLQANKLEDPAPGPRGIVLSKKPAAELKLSKQKLVQGMVEFSLETVRAADAAEAVALAESGGTTALSKNVKGDTSKASAADRVQAGKGGTASSAGGACRKAESGSDGKTTTGTPVWRDNNKGAETGNLAEGGTAAAGAKGRKGRQQQHAASAAAATAADKPVAKQRLTTEWEGVTWDEGDIPEAESLGTVSVGMATISSASLGTDGSITLGTVELASRNGDMAHAGLSDAVHQDLLVCLKEVVGVREAQKFGDLKYFCVLEVGQREVDRTRQVKPNPELVWEAPEERFRVAIEDIKEAKPAPNSIGFVNTTNATGAATPASGRHPPSLATAKNGEQMTRSLAEAGGDGEGAGDATLGADLDGGAPVSKLRIPAPALRRHSQQPHHGREVAAGASSLTIGVWSKGTVMGGRRDVLVGTATVPTRYIDHPPGDAWIPLAAGGDSRGDGQAGGKAEHKVGGGGRAEDAAAVGTESKNPDVTPAPAGGTTTVSAKPGGRSPWGVGLFKKGRAARKRGGGTGSGQHRTLSSSSVHVWLGKARRGSTSGQQPGEGYAILRIHSASGLRKADRYGSSDPKCLVVWNGEKAGSTSTVYDKSDPCWDREKESFTLRLPRDRSLCQLHVDIWDMDFAGTKRGDFLGRATIPTVAVLHPPPGGVETPITLPLLPLNGPADAPNADRERVMERGTTEAAIVNPAAAAVDAGPAGLKATSSGGALSPAAGVPSPRRETRHGRGAGTAGGFASRMMHSVQKHLQIGDTITGTLTVSLELFQYGDQEEGLALGGGVREPRAPRARAGYAASKFKVAEDAHEARRRREREGIHVPRMLSRVQALHNKLEGSVITGPAAVRFLDMTNGAEAIIPEILAGQVLSLARRAGGEGGHTVLVASGSDDVARDRLVVLLQPIPTDGIHSDGSVGGGEVGDSVSRSGNQDAAARRERLRQRKGSADIVVRGADERPRHVIVIPCLPGQISKEDVAVALELARAADEACNIVHKRRLRQYMMARCAENVETLCLKRKQHHEGLFGDVVSTLNPACSGAGPEVDGPLRDMPVAAFLLSSGGYRLNVVASSAGWSDGHAFNQCSAATSASGGAGARSVTSAGDLESVGRWSGPLPMASGLVKRAVERGDIFLVIESTVYVANVSWSSIRQETMPHKHVSSSTALETSVALLREAIGPKAANAFVLAPLWAHGVGSIGLITIADIPYAKQSPVAGRGGGGGRRMNQGHRVGSTRRPGKYNAGHGASHEDTSTFGEVGRGQRVRYAVGAGVVDFARRVGVALGTAAFQLRNQDLVTRIRVEGGGYSRYTSSGDGRGGKNRSRLGSPRSPARPSPPRVGGQQGTSIRGTSTAQGTRSVKRTTNVPIGDSNKRGQFSSPPRSIRRPELDEVGLSIWGSLDMTSILRWPCPYEAVCKIYSAAVKALTEGLPWVRAADVWHVSSIPDHKKVFETETPSPPMKTRKDNNDVAVDDEASIVDGNNTVDGDMGSIGSLTVDSGGTAGHGGEIRGGAYFCERIVGKTWSGAPAVILRSLRVPGRDEAACAARWLRGNGEGGGGVFGDDDGWTDQRLRLLAGEWRACTSAGGVPDYGLASGGGGGPGFRSRDITAATTPATVGSGTSGTAAVAGSDTAAILSSPLPLALSPRATPRPFMLHTGHVIVPFLNGRVRETERGGPNVVIGHGVVLAVDRGVDWRCWESHLTETAAVATRCFERLEREGESVERERVNDWAEKLLNRNTAGPK